MTSTIILPPAAAASARAPRTARHLLLAIVLVVLAAVAWLPTVLQLRSPSADQVWENFGLWSVCVPGQFQLGWSGPVAGVSTGGAFAASRPAAAIQWLSCQLAHHSPLNGLQSFLILGLALTFLLALISCRLAGFRPLSSLLVAFLITTAPCSFSRVGHLSLATLWPVIPGLLACRGLWRAMLPSTSPAGWLALAGAGALASALCVPSQEYYIFFVVLLLGASFLLLLFLASTRTTSLKALGAIAGRGLMFLLGALAVVLLAYLPKLFVFTAGGGGGGSPPPEAWATSRGAGDQFLYGLLPFTWLIPSPWVPMLSRILTNSGIPPTTESFFWSTGSFLIPIAWMTALWQMMLPASRRPPREVRFFACLLALVSGVGLLWMTMGGLGTLFAAVISPVLRSLNRYTVFVYGASLLLLASVLDAHLQGRTGREFAASEPIQP